MNKKDFTRDRKLPFSKVLLTIVRKSVKSIQNVLNETQKHLSNLLDEDLETISKSAYSQARDKLNYKAFEELANDASDMFYKDNKYKIFKGFRLLAIDGSMVTLPNNEDIKKEFCTTNVINQYKDKSKTIVQARVSVLYDVLNNITLDAVIENSNISEVVIAKNNHFKQLKKEDLLLADRGYPSYEFFSTITEKYNSNFLIRMKKTMYKDIQFLFDKNSLIKDTIVTLKPTTKKLREEIIQQNLPLEIKVRFVQVILDDGEVEVIGTSVLDKDVLETKDFKGYTPIVGHVNGGYIISSEFRDGNIAPADTNLEFVKKCIKQLPDNKKIKWLRADSATYQAKIFNYCEDNGINFAIGGQLDRPTLKMIKRIDDWKMLSKHEDVSEFVHTMTNTKKSFRMIVIKRNITPILPNLEEILSDEEKLQYHKERFYVIATNNNDLSIEKIIKRYRQRGETSENKIKELKNGFNLSYMPSSNFISNALYFQIGTLAYNIFILFKMILDKNLQKHTIKTIRYKLYNIAGKVVNHARKTILKVND